MKKAIGMYFLDSHIRMAQVSWNTGQATVERMTDCPWDRTLLPTQRANIARDIEAALKRGGLDPELPVVVGLSGDWVSYVPVKTDTIRDQDLTRFLQFELEDDVPVRFDNLQVDMLNPRRTEKKLQGLAVVCDRAETEAICHLLESAGLNVQSIGPDLKGLDGLAVPCASRMDVTWTLHLHLEHRRCLLVLSKNGIISMGRSLRCNTASDESLTHDLTLILREVFTGPLYGVKANDLAIAVSMSKVFRSPVIATFARVCSGTVEVCETDVLMESGKPSDVAGQLASAHLCGSPMPNFMASQLTQKQLKREMHVAGGLMIFLLVLLSMMWGVGAFLKIKNLRREQAQLTQEIEAVFDEHLPEVDRIVQPVTQMSNHLETYRTESEFLIQTIQKRASPLEVLVHISRLIGMKQDISINVLDIDSTKVTVAGTAPSYESTETLADALRKVSSFHNVQLGDMATDQTGGQVRFELSILRRTAP